MKLRYIGPTESLSLTNNKIYDCISVEDSLVRIIDDEELINFDDEELKNAIDNNDISYGYLYSIIKPKPSGSLEYGIWEIVEDSKEKILEKTIDKYIKMYNSKGNDFEKFKVEKLSKCNR